MAGRGGWDDWPMIGVAGKLELFLQSSYVSVSKTHAGLENGIA